jgi:hypothetical protein
VDKICNKEVIFVSLTRYIWIIRSRRDASDVHVVLMLESIKAYKILSQKPKGDGLLGALAVDGREMLELML